MSSDFCFLLDILYSMRHCAWLLLYLCLCLTAQAEDKVRTWTNLQGRTMQAQFVREVDGDVVFLKDGKLITLSLDQLSEADRQVIRDLQNAAQGGGDLPRADGAAANPFRPVSPARSPATIDRPLVQTKKKVAIVDRTWTDSDGKQTTAKFVRVRDGNVVLLRGARTVTIPFDSLTAADQEYVRQVLISRGEEDLIPTPPAQAEPAAPPVGEPSASNSPTPVAPDVDPGPKIGRGNSDIFDQFRQREDEKRQQHVQDAAKVQPSAAENQGQAELTNQPPPERAAPEQATPDQANETTSSGARNNATSSGGFRTKIDPLMARDVRGAVTIVLVAVGVFGTLGIVIFIAISIAGTSSARRQRRYNA